MRTLSSLLLSMALLAVLIGTVHAPPTLGSTIFFDDFLQSQLSPNWNVVAAQGPLELGNVSQSNGWLSLTENRNALQQSTFVPVGTSIVASNISPLISSQRTIVPATLPSLDGNNANYTYNGGGSSTSVTIGTTINNYYFLFIEVATAINAAPLVSSVSGTNDNGWAIRTSIFGNSNGIRLYDYVTTGKGGSDTISISLNTTCGPAGNNCVLMGEVFGLSGVSKLDGFSTNCVSPSTSNSVSPIDSFFNPVTLIAFTGTIGVASAISPGSGATSLFNAWNGGSGSFTTHASEYKKLNQGTGSDPIGFTYGSSVGSCLLGDSVEGSATQTALSNGNTGFYYMVWRMIPFNFSQIGNYNSGSTSVIRNAVTVFGMFQQNATIGATQFPNFFGNGLGFELVESDAVNNNPGLTIGGQKEAVSIVIGNPMYPGAGFTLGSRCFWSGLGGMEPYPGPILCSSINPSIIYSTPNAPIDLNAVHIFTMEANLQTNGQSWAAFQVDDNAFINVTQASCSCFEYGSPPGGYGNLYPYINAAYYASLPSATGQSKRSTSIPNQSLGTQIDYVLVADHIVANLPAGNIVSSGVTPPPQIGPLGGVGGLSLPSFLQFEANAISPGNIFAGGMLLTGLFCAIAFPFMVFAARKAGIGVRGFGFFYSILVLSLAFFGFLIGILPVWIPVTTTIIAMAIVFGVIQTGSPEGGVVPE